MKKNVTAILLAAIIAAGSIGNGSAFAAETSAPEDVSAVDSTEQEAGFVEEETTEGDAEESEENENAPESAVDFATSEDGAAVEEEEGNETTEETEDPDIEPEEQAADEETDADGMTENADFDGDADPYAQTAEDETTAVSEETLEQNDGKEIALEVEGDVEEDLVDSGTCGENAVWKLTGTGNDLILTISGTGSMYEYGGSPWESYSGRIVSAVIEEGITSIGSYSFYGLKEMRSVIIPDGVTSIGYNAFAMDDKLTSITIPDGVTSVDDNAFYKRDGSESIRDIHVPSIRAWLNFPEHNIGEHLFIGDEEVTSVIIPEDITTIDDYTFSCFANLTDVTIPDSVTSIGNNAFIGCSSLTSIKIPDGVSCIEPYTFAGCSSLSNVEIPDSVTSIEGYSFFGCGSLTEITIPDHVTSIGQGAFQNCTGLTDLTIPSSAKNIGDWAFAGCTGLTSIELSEGAMLTGSSVFEGCLNLTNVELSEGIDSIPYSTFRKCTGSTGITIPEGVTEIEEDAFCECSSLTSVVLPGSLKSIGECSFQLCRNLKEISFAEGLERIGRHAFDRCSMTSVVIPESVRIIEDFAFESCAKLKKCYILGNNTAFENGTVFYISHNVNLYCPEGSKAYSFTQKNDMEVTIAPIAPVINKVTNTVAGSSVEWTKVPDATGYDIYRKIGNGSYSRVKRVSGNSTVKWVDTEAKKSNTKYTYKIYSRKALDGRVYQGSASPQKISYYIERPTVTSITNTAAGVKVTWKKVDGISGYCVYRKTGTGTYSRVKTISNASTVTFTDTNAKTNGVRYAYFVVAYRKISGITYRSANSAEKISYFLPRITVSSLTNSAPNKMTVKWGRNAKASGYLVQYSLRNNFASGNKTVTISKNSVVSKVIGSLSKGKKYYVRIRAYKVVGGKKFTPAGAQ